MVPQDDRGGVGPVPGVALNEGQSGGVGDSRSDGSDQGAGDACNGNRGLRTGHVGEVMGGFDRGEDQPVLQGEVRVGGTRGIRGWGSSPRWWRDPRPITCVGVAGSGMVGDPQLETTASGVQTAALVGAQCIAEVLKQAVGCPAGATVPGATTAASPATR